MRLLKKCMAILGYLLLLCVLLDFRLNDLIDIKQMLLVILGGWILCLPSIPIRNFRKPSDEEWHIWADCTLWASFLETFILLFLFLGNAKDIEHMYGELALNLRPLLYGFCIWHIFGDAGLKKESEHPEETESSDGKEKKLPPQLSVSESYHMFQSLGLTKRETEVAVLICQGFGNGEIAERLSISEATVKKHVSNIFEKFGITKREQVYTYLCRHAQQESYESML